MLNGNHNNVESKTREVRLGLVMYGGVSLAVYINGVAAEFFRAVHGRGIYRVIKALTDSDIVVDIISGTSAGGINGILLGYALCNNKDFFSSATLWRRDGDIRSLLRSPKHDKDGVQSLLNSEGYYQPRLEEAFRYMRDYVPEDGEMGSEFEELDLFVTGTDVDGNITTQFDDAGHAIDVKDHRSVFLLKHRKGRKEPFNPQTNDAGAGKPNPDAIYKALAKLARITSCFPAAFTPVYVTADRSEEDKILQGWGKLDKDSCFLDGGVIDNKPFTYTLKEIFERTATRQIDRKLFYVEPDPEHFSRVESASNPNIYEAIIASLIGIPGYESIADDLKLLATHNSKLNQYKRLIRSLDSSEQYEVSPMQQHIYEQSRLISISERVVQGILKEEGKNRQVSQRDRKTAAALVSAFDGMVEEAGEDGRGAIAYAKSVLRNFDVYFRLRRLYRIVYMIAERLYEKKNPIQGEKRARYKKLWREFNRQSKLLEILRVRMEDLIDQAPIQWRVTIEKKLELDEQASLSREVAQMWSVVSLAMRNFLDVNKKMAGILPEAYREPEGTTEWLDQETLSKINQLLKDDVAKKIIAEIYNNPPSPQLPEPDTKRSLLFLTDSYEEQILKSIIDDDSDPVCMAYKNFQSLDTLLFPMEMIAELHEKDIIQTIRISPSDAEKGFSAKSLADKVSGDTLYHFGGFFKRSWRSNDILWGRLDSCCQIIESLLDRERIKDLLNSPIMRKRMRGYFSTDPEDSGSIHWINSMDPATLFHHSGEPTHEALRGWIENLLSEDESRRAAALDKGEFKNHTNWLIEAAQLEIIKEEVQCVIADALGEQAQWNQFRVPRLEIGSTGDNSNIYTGPFAFSPIRGNLDPFVSVVAAAGQAQSVMAKLVDEPNAKPARPTKTRLGQFFMNEYNIGTEALLKDMPSLILLEILSVSLLVLRNCVLGIFGERAAKIKRNPLYLFALDYPLRAFNALVLFIRRAPMTWKMLLAIFFFVSVIALAIGISWRDSIIYEGDKFKLRWFIVFIAAPVLILFSQGLFLWRGRVHKVGLPRIARDIIMSLLLLSPLVLLAVAYREITLVYQYIPEQVQPEKVAEFQKAISSRLASAALFASLFLIFVLLFFKFALRSFKKFWRQKPKELQYALEDFFDFADIKLIADRLDIPATVIPRAPFLDETTARERREMKRKMAAAVVKWAKNEKRLSALEEAMRAINPEPLYYL